MNIVASRVDERLVHGQIMTSWSKHLQLRCIVVVDDQVAADDFMTSVLSLSAPAGITIKILSVSDAAQEVVSDTSDVATMLLFKKVSAALQLAKTLADTSHTLHELNLGNLGSVPGRVQVTKNVFLSDEERDQIRELLGMGVDVFLQMLYTEPRVAARDII
jgi:PTS system mannose-specific IIB component